MEKFQEKVGKKNIIWLNGERAETIFGGGRVLLEHAAEGARIKLTPARSMKAQCGW